jgi:hypothetical protein
MTQQKEKEVKSGGRPVHQRSRTNTKFSCKSGSPVADINEA